MMKDSKNFSGWLRCAIATLALAGPAAASAQEADTPPAPAAADTSVTMEEVVVIGRFKAAATDVVAERIESDVPMDFLDAEAISRAGDSDVAAALRRMPGLTLAKGRFIYVRGLGERYSSTLLNGARVPSPDLTRSVLPLDIFPAAVVDSLAVSKGYSPDLPAAFGGGNVDIRTSSIPDDVVFNLQLQSGWTSDQSSKGLTYDGGNTDWQGKDDGTRQQSQVLLDAIQTFQGDFNSINIQQRLLGDGVAVTLDHAAQINRDLAKELYRDIDLDTSKDLPPDYNISGTIGNAWYFRENWEFGAMAYGEYDRSWRNLDRVNRLVSNPETDFTNTKRTVDEVNITGSMHAGVKWADEQEINALYLYIRNTDDDSSLSRGCKQGQFNDCGDDDPNESRIVRYRYEERTLLARQLHGDHTLGIQTLEVLPEWLQWLEVIEGANINWFYSSSDVKTDLPSEIAINGVASLDPNDLTVIPGSEAVQPSGSSLDYRYSHLHDYIEDSGINFMVPVLWRDFDMEFSSGYSYLQKSRNYEQYSYGLGSTALGFDDIRFNEPSVVFSDENLDVPLYGMELLVGIGGFGSESYAAAETLSATYFKADILWDETWRLSGGARYEDYQQATVPIDWTGFGRERIPLDDPLAENLAESATVENDWYPSVFLTYIRPGFLADDFQARFGFSQTVARPDLREISPSTYIDPITEARVQGNPLLESSDLDNYDVRLGWYWNSGDNFSISGFYKDISQPIETVQGGATEDNILFNFVNAESADVYGVELEGLKSLGFMSGLVGEWIEAFYFSGNLTLSDSEIKTPPGAGVGNITNEKRKLTQQSPWVVNAQLGYDSFNGKHSATVVYNAFGERIFFAGIDGFDDAKEQPFNSLDFVYSYFPTEEISLRFRVKNLLDENIHIKQNGVDILEQDLSIEYLFDFTWSL